MPTDLLTSAERAERIGILRAERAFRDNLKVDFDQLAIAANCFSVAAALRARANSNGSMGGTE